MKKVAYKEKSISEHPKRERRKLEKGLDQGRRRARRSTLHCRPPPRARSMCCTSRAIRAWLGSLGVGVR